MLVSSFDISSVNYGSSAMRATYSAYWLELTNLSDRTISFEVAAHVTRYSSYPYGQPTDPNVQLAELKNFVGGAVAGDYYTWYAGGWALESGHPVLRLTVPVPANSSQPVRLSAFSVNRFPRAEGYVELTVPVIRSEKPPFNWIPQSDRPVPVLLYPATEESATQGGSAISSVRQPLPLVSGQPYNEIPPNTELRVRRFPIRDLLVRDPAFVAKAAGAGPADEDDVRSVVDLLTSLDADDRAALNELLQKMESPIRVERRD